MTQDARIPKLAESSQDGPESTALDAAAPQEPKAAAAPVAAPLAESSQEESKVAALDAAVPHEPKAAAAPVAPPAVPTLLERLSADRPGMPVCLITGFLGAGKTTLVNHILANAQGLRAAVFVNEYGSVDVDGALIRSRIDEDRVISLTNGCICCEVNEDLAKQLSGLLRDRGASIDLVIIETSGVCDPEPVLTTLQQIEDVDQVHLDTVVCLVDAETLDDEEMGASFDAKRQLAHADVVLLNKVDRLESAEKVEEAERRLQAYCKAQEVQPIVLRTERAEVDLAALCGLELRGEGERPSKRPRLEAPQGQHGHHGPHAHGKHGRFATFAHRASRPFDMMKFEAWAESPPAGVLRAKGLLWMRGIPKYVCFHLAGRRTNPFETLPGAGQPQGSEIVFIGRAGAGAMDAAAVTEALDKCLA